jgi:hypothetical protein
MTEQVRSCTALAAVLFVRQRVPGWLSGLEVFGEGALDVPAEPLGGPACRCYPGAAGRGGEAAVLDFRTILFATSPA